MSAFPVQAEEGMWPFNMVPKNEIKSTYGVDISDVWLEKVRMSSVRFGAGGSSSFVSPNGLLMTNQHVGRGCIQKLSHGEENLLRDGFYAESYEEERVCPGLEVNQTIAITNVTEEVKKAAADVKKRADQNKKQKAKMAQIEKECVQDPSLFRCEVVTLYGGGEYHLYRYRKYTDVRLVWAPENDAKHFGGEKDNFEFPRMSLDVSFFRVYENGKPLESESHYFSFSKSGAKEGDVVFVSGHPGRTGRLASMGELRYLKETAYPFYVEWFTKMRKNYESYMEQGESSRQTALADWLRASNAEKALTGYLRGLQDDALMTQIQARHQALLDALSKKGADAKKLKKAWKEIDESYDGFTKHFTRWAVTEGYFSPRATAAINARHLVRLSGELAKKDGQRLREYSDSNLTRIELELFSEAPVDRDLETEKIAFSLEAMQAAFGKNDPLIKRLLKGKSPRARAQAIVNDTKLYDVKTRRDLYAKNASGVKSSKDAMIQFVKGYDKVARKYRKLYEDSVEATTRAQAGHIAAAYSQAYGRAMYPDATFTLRLSYGSVKGYDVDGKKISWATQVGDIYRTNRRWKNQEPYVLPERFEKNISNVNFSVPYNFVSTNDIIGGNSGSPIINQNAEIVGLIFDGNIYQLSNRFEYRSEKERAVSVHSQGMLHILKNIYQAKGLVEELQPGLYAANGKDADCCDPGKAQKDDSDCCDPEEGKQAGKKEDSDCCD